jgi:deoxyadenosine/deoxycytidine kinase
MGKLIALTGNTGVGKTSLARALARTGEFSLAYEEHAGRPFQELVGLDPRYTLANQVDYLLLRAEQERSLRLGPQTGLVDGGLDLDFYVFTRLFQTRGWLNPDEYALCERLYRFFRADLPLPDLIIHLTASEATVRARLAGRDRINLASPADLTLLETFLDQWLATLPPERVLRLDVSSVSPAYTEMLPNLLPRLRRRLGLDAGAYETGYIP